MSEETHHTYTAFCKNKDDTGTTWIGSVELTGLQLMGLTEEGQIALIQNTAREACAVDWYGSWNEEKLDGIACYCIIPGTPGVLYFEDLSDN